MKDCGQGKAVSMIGGAYERGLMQASHANHNEVLSAINLRLDKNKEVFKDPVVREYVTKQREFAKKHCSEELSEMNGVADGFGVDPNRLFDFLHMGIVTNLDKEIVSEDGCSTWAVSCLSEGPAVGKNRDYSGEHAALQAVFLHEDPDWPKQRRVLCVGSMGAPGAYSSGINSEGLVVVDTHIPTSDYGSGWLRYFLMTRLLSHHTTVASALDFIKSVLHAGGGSLIIADPSGRVAAIDLGHKSVSIVERNNGWVARTNHFEAGSVANNNDDARKTGNTLARYNALTAALSQQDKSLQSLKALICSHTTDKAEGLCCHGGDDDSHTLSGAIFLCESRKLYFTNGYPCNTDWQEFSV